MATTVPKQEWRQVFSTLVEHHGSVEVTHRRETGEQSPVYHTRILAFDDEGFVIERPQLPAAANDFKIGVRLQILATHETQRWQCIACIEQSLRFEINDKITVPAISLTVPHSAILQEQRRDCFRVSTTALQLPPAVFVPIVESVEPDADSAPSGIIAQAFSGRILNVAGGGIAAAIPKRHEPHLEQMQLYHCQFTLPTVQGPIEIPARLVHISPLSDKTVYLGLKFEGDEQFEYETDIIRFTTSQQRLQLKRRRH